MRIETIAALRIRKCVDCAAPFGKWSCCDEAHCNKCILSHAARHTIANEETRP